MTKRKMSREDLEAAFEQARHNEDAARMYASCLRDGTKPALVIPDVMGGTDGHGNDGEYWERWTLYRPESAAGGVLIVEQGAAGSDVPLAWSAHVACVFLSRMSGADHWRQSAMAKVYSAQTQSLEPSRGV